MSGRISATERTKINRVLLNLMPVPEAVAAALAKGGVWTANELVAETGYSDCSVRRALNIGIKAGKFVSGRIQGERFVWGYRRK